MQQQQVDPLHAQRLEAALSALAQPVGREVVDPHLRRDPQLVPLAADVTDKQGNFQGAAGLPKTWQNYKFIDLTYQTTAGKNIGHGTSVMRGPLTAPQQQAGGTGTGTGTQTSP